MPSIAEFTIPAEKFALQETLERLPDVEIEVDRVVAHDTTQVLSFVWVSGNSSEELPVVLKDDPSITENELLAEYEDEQFYRMAWADDVQVVGYMIIEQDAVVQRAIARNKEWHPRVLFPDRSEAQRSTTTPKSTAFPPISNASITSTPFVVFGTISPAITTRNSSKDSSTAITTFHGKPS